MGIMCSKCFEICYSFEGCNICLRKDCDGEKVIIDNLMLPIIQILNQKKYKTIACCSGHVEDAESFTYIKFDDSVDLPYMPEEFRYRGYTVIQCIIMTSTCKDIDIDINIKNLLQWAMSLPINPLY